MNSPVKNDTTDTKPAKPTTKTVTVKPKEKPVVVAKNPEQIKKAVALGKELVNKMASDPEITKASIAREMYPLLQDEPREIIAQAFVDGAGLTPKGAMTYVYNTRRKATKQQKENKDNQGA